MTYQIKNTILCYGIVEDSLVESKEYMKRMMR